ncbi:N-acetylglucosamine-6-phosphate deacetylase [Fimbriimonas ginsengisoli]|uniref:N-acetylglucosamine-6-phosphate deacetylase n=1 Tax=Fimbriimonas ginsengisoli Gsoil 348 TaxID=661478 RepID=A0A068NLN7_FIMGI|nr:amidohydrolase family protein [Fimbriimonas ginsengisoli]AIE84391.1 N-acetylglucosamine-6-phosphate deacetylase [Fimbriimonas ginsengisoli Gsoil 348]
MKKVVLAYGPRGFGNYTFDTETLEFSGSPDTRSGPLIIPGFIDIHTHGAFGIDFMSATVDEMRDLCCELSKVGYEGFLPTTVTAPVAQVRQALARLPDDPMILGFHLEGPFISPRYPGAQPQGDIVDPPVGVSEWDPILDDSRLKVITLAPERPGGGDLIRRLSNRNVKVSIGHTEATYTQCREAFAMGARHTTHTFNAMRPLHHREPGAVGFALTENDVFTELIYDRHHVAREAAEVLLRCKPESRVLAISDSTMAAGVPSGTHLKMWGLDCHVSEGTVRLADGTLAGSAITLLDAFRNLKEDFGWSTAVNACCINPRIALGLSTTEARTYLELDPDLNIVARYDRKK